jgi:flavin prenyltransferase
LRRIIVGITGASGIPYATRVLEMLRAYPVFEVHLVMSKAAKRVVAEESDLSLDQIRDLADVNHATDDLGASIASGSFRTEGMIVVPCSMKSVSEIAYSNTTNLLTRAADVTLKEGRKLLVVPRESPLRESHLEAMIRIKREGGVILPPSPAFYTRPSGIEDIVDHTAGRILDHFGVETNIPRWGHESVQADVR